MLSRFDMVAGKDNLQGGTGGSSRRGQSHSEVRPLWIADCMCARRVVDFTYCWKVVCDHAEVYAGLLTEEQTIRAVSHIGDLSCFQCLPFLSFMITENTGPLGELQDTDRFQSAILQYRNCPDKDTKLSPSHVCIWLAHSGLHSHLTWTLSTT